MDKKIKEGDIVYIVKRDFSIKSFTVDTITNNNEKESTYIAISNGKKKFSFVDRDISKRVFTTFDDAVKVRNDELDMRLKRTPEEFDDPNLFALLKDIGYTRYLVEDFETAETRSGRKYIIANEDGVYITYKYGQTMGELVSWSADELQEDYSACIAMIEYVKTFDNMSETDLDNSISKNSYLLPWCYTPYSDKQVQLEGR